MVELKTPSEIIENLVDNIEKTRKQKKMRQKDLCQKSDVPLSTYQDFIYKKSINITNLIKIMYTLKMFDNLEGLIGFKDIKSVEDIRAAKKQKRFPERIRVGNEKR
jgi:predicted transcriptional regulator